MKTFLLTIEEDINHLLHLLINDQAYENIDELLLEGFENFLHDKIASHCSIIIFNKLATKDYKSKFSVIDILEEVNIKITNINILIMVEENIFRFLEKENCQFTISPHRRFSTMHEILLHR